MTGFLTLDSLVLPAPLPAIVALLMVCGMAGIACRFADSPRRPAAFVVAVALVGGLVNALLLAHLAGLLMLRILAGGLLATGVLTIGGTLRAVLRQASGLWGGSLIERAAFLIAGSAVAGLGLAALGPVTDVDSLDYHLGVPLDWLRHSGVTMQPHWLHARLTGLGEAVNTIGLAAGTDCLGAVLQVSGLLLVLGEVTGAGRKLRDRMLGIMLVLTPAILPLTIAQKPQLFPSAALVVAMALARTAESGSDFALVFGCVAFALACKYSFAVSGAVVVAVALYRARELHLVPRAAGWAAVAFAVFTGPVLLRNFALYGDPVSPFLEGLRQQPDQEVSLFATQLANVGGFHNAAGIAYFLVHSVWPASAGEVQTVLGIGILALLVAGFGGKALVPLAGFAAILGFVLWRGQMASRYLLEGYFWCAAAAVAAPWSRLKGVLFYGLTVQTAGVAVAALFAAGLLFPGALTPGWREHVMQQSTFGYAEARWLDRVVPQDATIITSDRANALHPRPFRILRCASCASAAPPDPPQRADFNDPKAVLVVDYPAGEDASAAGPVMEGCTRIVVAGPQRLPYVTRNPFNRQEYEAVAVRMVCP